MAIQTAKTLDAGVTRKRVIYQSEALFSGSSNIERVQSINYSFTVPRTDVNQYGQLGQIERIITEVPTVSLDFTYHLNGTTNETILLGAGANGTAAGFMKDLNNPQQPQYEQQFTVGLSDEGTDFNNGHTHLDLQMLVRQTQTAIYPSLVLILFMFRALRFLSIFLGNLFRGLVINLSLLEL